MADAAVREFVLQVEERTGTGTGECRRLRAKGRIPGNLYGLGRSPFNVAVNPKTIDEILHMGSGVKTIMPLQE